MEHRDQRQESHGVHVCNKCGWPFPNPHPSAKHRRAHKRVCGTVEGFKLVVESEANTLLTISDDDGDQKSSSPKVSGGSCDDKGVDGMKKKSKESEDEVFSDAVTEFSEGIGPEKFVGDALDSVSSTNMVAEDSSQTLKDREVLETIINQSGSEQKSIINQESVNLETDSGTLLSSSATENRIVENLVVAETAIDRSGNEQETKVDQELVNLKTDFGTPSPPSSSSENRKVEISVSEATINQSGTEQETKINQESVNLETDSGTLLSSSATENKKAVNLVVAETAIDRFVNEQETKVDQGLVNFKTYFGTPSPSSPSENRKVEISVVSEATINQSGTEQETKINQEFVNLETNIRTGNSVAPPNDHMNTSTASDLYPVEPEIMIPALQQERNVDSVENVPQCSLLSPDRRCDEKKNEDFGLCKNLAEIAAASGKMDNIKSQPEPKMEETIEIPTEPFAHNVTLQSVAVNDKSVHPEMPPSVVVSDVKPIDLTQVTSEVRKELESCSSKSLQETDKIKEEIDNVHLASASSELNVVDRPEALVEDSKNHKEVKLTNCVERVSSLEDNFKDPIPEESYSTLQAEPFDQASEVASFDTKTVESKQKPESRGDNVSVDVKADCSRNSGQETEEIPIQQVNASHIEGILSENEKHDKSQTLSDAAKFGIDSTPSASFYPEVEPVAPSQNSLDNLSENVTEVLFNEKSMAAPTGNVDENEVGIGGVLLADEENKAGACGRNFEDTVQVRLPVDARERKDDGVGEKDIFDNLFSSSAGVLLADDENKAGACGRNFEDTVQVCLPVDARERKDDGVGEKDKFDNLDIAGVEDNNDPSEELFSIGIDSTHESTTNSRENECITVAEAIADESSGKISGIESADSREYDISLASGTQQSVEEDDRSSSVHVACISEVVSSDDQSCHVRDFNSVRNSSYIHANKEANLVSVSNESVTGRLDASQDGSVSHLIGDAVKIAPETWKDDGVKIDVKPQLTPSLLDASVDASSRTDSLEGNWGSISVLSTQSDLPAVVDGEVTLQARAAEETDLKKVDATTERQHSDRSDLFEAPSFMTLVEPNAGGIQDSAASEIQTAQNRQQPTGWFPSYTHVANDSPGRKKNEAIIAKVTNWSTGKPHTALKNLLDDAALENKQKSLTQKNNLASMIQKDEKVMKNGSVVDMTVDSVPLQKMPTSQLGNREIANEWNSPARYPSDIKRERRKGRPYWAQFVCCSSVH